MQHTLPVRPYPILSTRFIPNPKSQQSLLPLLIFVCWGKASSPMRSSFFTGISLAVHGKNPSQLRSMAGFCLIAEGDFLNSGALLAENACCGCMEKLLRWDHTLLCQTICAGPDSPWSITSVLRQKCCASEHKLQLSIVFIHQNGIHNFIWGYFIPVTNTPKSSWVSHLLVNKEKSKSDSLSFWFWLMLKVKSC